MKFLLINTCGAEGVVGLADETGVVVEEMLPGRGTSEHLMPAVRRLFAETGWTVAGLTAVAVVTGPGSFTGVRVGLSAAKGLCEAGGVGMVGMSRLGLVAGAAGTRVALLDAGRGEYYCGVYRNGQCVVEELMTGVEVARLMGDGGAVTCEPRVAEALGDGVELVAEPGVMAMLAESLRRVAAGAWSDVALTDANYLRRTDAELLAKGK